MQKNIKFLLQRDGKLHLSASITKGMVLQAGNVLGSITNKKEELVIETLLPSSERPRIHKGDERAAVIELSNIGASYAALGFMTYSLLATVIGSASTGVGVIVAAFAAVGATITFTAAAHQFGMFVAAASLYLSKGGFRDNSTTILGKYFFWGVASL